MSIERVHYCGLYIPGHDVHWIQAKLGSKDKTNLPARFCVADADRPDLRPCPAHPPTGDPADLLREAGGFSIPGPEALSWMESS
jgi:hypothetical protein